METLGATLHPPALMDDGLEELGSTYKGIGTIFFLWAKHEETSESCKQLASKAVQYYYKAMLKGESGANKLLLDIVNWATQTDASSKKNPSLMKLICKAMDEKAPCKAASQASLLLLDFIINQGAPLFGKCKKRNTIVCFQDDLHSWKNDCEERFKRLQSLAVFLQMPQVLMSRQDLFQLLIDFIPSKFTTHSFYKSFHTDFHVVLSRVASVNLSYSQALDEASEEEPTSTYKDIATLFFLWAKCKLSEIGSTKDEKLLRHCKQWAKKSLQYYYKAMWEGELETQLLFTIVDWAAHIYSSSSSPTLLKLVCKAIEDEGAYLVPSSNTYIQHLVASSYSYLKLVDGMLYEGITLLKEYMERFGGEGVMMDYGGSLLMMKECQKALERLTTLNGSLQQPHDLIGRLHLMHFLLNTLHFNKKDEAMETLATLMDNNQQIETLGATLNPRAMKTIVTLTREHQVRVLEEKRKREENERKILMKLKEKRMREEEEARREILLKLEEKRRLEEKVEREILINIEERKGILKMEAHKSAESYLRFLYKEYPHPNPNKKLESISNPMETREALRMAIHHYHPDTNIKHGREWVSFCNEVTKFLNNKYMNYTDELL